MKSTMLNSIVCVASFLIALIAFLGAASAQNPVPLINQPLVPDATKPGGAGFTLTVNGTGFVSGSVVHWNGNARATTFVSPSKLTATITASDIAVAGSGLHRSESEPRLSFLSCGTRTAQCRRAMRWIRQLG